MGSYFRRSRPAWIVLWIDAFVLLAWFLLRGDRALMNRVAGVTAHYRAFAGRLSALVPFSVNDAAYAALVLGALAFVICSAVAVIRNPGRRWSLALSRLTVLACAAVTLYTAFCLLWGVNYYTDNFRDHSGLRDEPISVDTLEEVTRCFADGLCASADTVARDENGVFAVPRGEILAAAPEIYRGVAAEYPFLAGEDAPPKGMFFSRIMSALNFTGVYLAFTGESGVNVDSPACLLPSTAAHELAHRRGYAEEEECSFIGILACLRSDNAAYRYSGYLDGFIYLSNALYRADRERWEAVYRTLPETVLADLRDNNAYWARFETKAAAVTDRVYDAMLRSYGQELGSQSYGAVVDLLAAYYRAGNRF